MLTSEQLTNILAEWNASLFMVKLSEMSSFSSGLLDLEDGGSMLLQNVWNYLRVSMAEHTRRLESSSHEGMAELQSLIFV